MKHVFVVPSWYPSKDDPVSGIFVKKQAEALRSLSTEYRPIVGLWGQCNENIPLNRPSEILPWLKAYTRRPRGEWTTENGVDTISDRAFSWSHRLPFGGAARLIDVTRKNIRRTIKRFERIDLIHAYVSYPAGHIARLMSREFDIPYVVTEFMGPFPFPAHRQKNGDVRVEIREAIEASNGLIVLSEYLGRRFSELSLREPTVIPFSVDHSRFSPRSRPADGLVKMLCCCRLVAEKGIFELVSSYAGALKTHPMLRLILIGTGPAESELKAHARRIGVADRVEWKGQMDNHAVAEAMAVSDFFVLPSRFDTFGVVYVEAMASGLPVIATRCGGPEGFISEEQGILVDVENISQLTAAMRRMAETHSNYDRVKIRSYSAGRFSDQTITNALSKFYDRVLQDTAGGSIDARTRSTSIQHRTEAGEN